MGKQVGADENRKPPPGHFDMETMLPVPVGIVKGAREKTVTLMSPHGGQSTIAFSKVCPAAFLTDGSIGSLTENP